MPAKRRIQSESAANRPATLGRLTHYSVSGLFGHSNYKFDLAQEEPTLLTGVNGTGKSTILKSIEALGTGDIITLLNIPFRSLSLTFESGEVLSSDRTADHLHITCTGEKAWTIPFDKHLRFLAEDEDLFAIYANLDQGPLTSRRLRELRNRMAHGQLPGTHFQAASYLMEHLEGKPEWVNLLPRRFPVLFITDQRLIVDNPARGGSEPRSADRVSTRVAAEEAARNVALEIAAAKNVYANRSQSLDRNFPQRVISAMRKPAVVSDKLLTEQLEQLAKQQKSLSDVGLLPAEVRNEFDELDLTAGSVRAVIATYLQDTREKLAVLEPIRHKLQLFSDFLNQHYKTNGTMGSKSVRIESEKGFVVYVDGGDPTPIAPSKLSSGEQQMMVLAHRILFGSDEGTLVLIDEPELSLHVLWQSSFIDDLTEMGKVRKLSFLLATHSPTLIGGREDLKRSLDVLGS